MGDPHDKKDDDPLNDATEHLKQGFGFLYRAAEDVAKTVKREVDKGGVGKVFDDAAREIARAANNVFSRFAVEIDRATSPRPEADETTDGTEKKPEKPTGPTPEDPGFRIAVDDDEPR